MKIRIRHKGMAGFILGWSWPPVSSPHCGFLLHLGTFTVEFWHVAR